MIDFESHEWVPLKNSYEVYIHYDTREQKLLKRQCIEG